MQRERGRGRHAALEGAKDRGASPERARPVYVGIRATSSTSPAARDSPRNALRLCHSNPATGPSPGPPAPRMPSSAHGAASAALGGAPRASPALSRPGAAAGACAGRETDRHGARVAPAARGRAGCSAHWLTATLRLPPPLPPTPLCHRLIALGSRARACRATYHPPSLPSACLQRAPHARQRCGSPPLRGATRRPLGRPAAGTTARTSAC